MREGDKREREFVCGSKGKRKIDCEIWIEKGKERGAVRERDKGYKDRKGGRERERKREE